MYSEISNYSYMFDIMFAKQILSLVCGHNLYSVYFLGTVKIMNITVNMPELAKRLVFVKMAT